MSYNASVNNSFRFVPLPDEELLARGDTLAADINWLDAVLSGEDYERATGRDTRFDFRATHRIPVSAPFSVNRLPLLGDLSLNFSPTFTYTEDWYLQSELRQLNADSSGIDVVNDPGFFALRQFSSFVSASTIFYGLFPVNAFGFRGIRHTPSVPMLVCRGGQISTQNAGDMYAPIPMLLGMRLITELFQVSAGASNRL